MTNATLKTKLGKVQSEIETLTKKRVDITAKLETLNAEASALSAKLANAFDTAKLEAGNTVTFEAGKPKVEKSGIIVGIKDGQAKIAVGSGFDAVLFTVKLDAITGVVTTDANHPPAAQ